MRTYEILDAQEHVMSEQTMSDTMAPALLPGQHARIKSVDGHEVASFQKGTLGSPSGVPIVPMPYVFITAGQEAGAKSRVAPVPVKE